MDNKHIKFYRKKTETTRKKNVKQITIPRTPVVNELLDKLGKKDSHFVLGLLKEEYSEETFVNKSNKMRREINGHLKAITEKLNLSHPLRTDIARECYATTLRRAKKPIDRISDGMGYSSIAVTKNHYIGNMNSEEIFELNDPFLANIRTDRAFKQSIAKASRFLKRLKTL